MVAMAVTENFGTRWRGAFGSFMISRSSLGCSHWLEPFYTQNAIIGWNLFTHRMQPLIGIYLHTECCNDVILQCHKTALRLRSRRHFWVIGYLIFLDWDFSSTLPYGLPGNSISDVPNLHLHRDWLFLKWYSRSRKRKGEEWATGEGLSLILFEFVVFVMYTREKLRRDTIHFQNVAATILDERSALVPQLL